MKRVGPLPITADWAYIDRYCGSGAIPLYLHGAGLKLVPYQGNKWRLRREIVGLFEQHARVVGPPASMVLMDQAPWPETLYTVMARRRELLGVLGPLVERGRADPRGTLRWILDQPSLSPVGGGSTLYPIDQLHQAARHLWLQRMAFRNKAVGLVHNRWVFPGLNGTSADGVVASSRFGAIRPLGAALLEAVIAAPEVPPGRFRMGSSRRTVVYLDPPYQGSTGYPGGTVTRTDLVRDARAYMLRGWHVFISEQEPVAELVAEGWKAVRLSSPKVARMGKPREEWVTHTTAG